jgi:hypothetical protein
MKNIITNAADITVLELIDNTFKTGGGPTAIGGTVLEASKGPVGEVVQVNADNWQDIFGMPFPAKAGGKMEGLRHLNDAVQEAVYVNVVRVVASDARFPSISIPQIIDRGAWAASTNYVLNDVVTVSDGRLLCIIAHESDSTPPTVAVPGANWQEYVPVETDNHAFGTVLSLGAGIMLQVWPVDGDASINRSFEIEKILNHTGAFQSTHVYAIGDMITIAGVEYVCRNGHTSGATAPNPVVGANWRLLTDQDKRFKINFYDKTLAGEEYLLESYTVGIAETDTDDMGRPAYIESVLSQQSDRFRCDLGVGIEWEDIQDTLTEATKTMFVGGTAGGTPTSQNYIDAWDTFRNESIPVFLLFAAGNYDTSVLANCIDIAADRHISFFFDAPYYLDSEAALTWLREACLSGRQAACYYCPYAATDRWYGGKTAWGASGAAVAACAKGDANFTGATPGIHYAPAGVKRATLTRTGVKPLFPADAINRDDFYTARINPVVSADSGGVFIDDSLALHFMQNYSRFIWVNRIANYIDHRFVEMANQFKHEPDGITYRGLSRGIKAILDELVTSGALSKPREPDIDGDSPYVFTVTQQEIDLWLVDWSFCPTGSARRIAGQPRLIK